MTHTTDTSNVATVTASSIRKEIEDLFHQWGNNGLNRHSHHQQQQQESNGNQVHHRCHHQYGDEGDDDGDLPHHHCRHCLLNKVLDNLLLLHKHKQQQQNQAGDPHHQHHHHHQRQQPPPQSTEKSSRPSSPPLFAEPTTPSSASAVAGATKTATTTKTRPGSSSSIDMILLKETIVRNLIHIMSEEDQTDDENLDGNKKEGAGGGGSDSETNLISPKATFDDDQDESSNDVLDRTLLNRIFDLCGIVVTITTCSTILKDVVVLSSTSTTTSNSSPLSLEIGTGSSDVSPVAYVDSKIGASSMGPASSLSSKNLVKMCWWTIQQQLLRTRWRNNDVMFSWKEDISRVEDEGSDDKNELALVDYHGFVTKTVLVLPQTVANAFHHTKLRNIPLESTQSYFYPRLVQSAVLRYYLIRTNNPHDSRRERTIDSSRSWSWFHGYVFTLLRTLISNSSGTHSRADAAVKGLMDASYSVQMGKCLNFPGSSSNTQHTDNSAAAVADVSGGGSGGSGGTGEFSGDRSFEALSLLPFVLVDSVGQKFIWTPREVSTLILTLLKYLEAHQRTAPQHFPVSTVSPLSEQARWMSSTTAPTILLTCQRLFHSHHTIPVDQQDMIIHHLVLSSNTFRRTGALADNNKNRSKNRLNRWAKWIVQVLTPPSEFDDIGLSEPSGIRSKDFALTEDALPYHLTTVSDRWSQWTFVQEVDAEQQHFVSLILWYGLKAISKRTPDDNSSSSALSSSDELTMNLVNGISCRLETSIDSSRQDGMRIAQEMAKNLGQDVKFDEYRPDDDDIVADSEFDGDCNIYANGTDEMKVTTPHVSDNGEKSDEDDDASVEWDNDLTPYDLEDDEDDLVETAAPLTLINALEMLRTGESHDHAFSRHEAALRTLADLIRERPDNLPDVAVSLSSEVLRMENKFNIPNFAEMRDRILHSLLVQEPGAVGKAMIDSLFDDGGLGDRLVILSVLQTAAGELSGIVDNIPPSSSSSSAPIPVELKTQLSSRSLSKTRQKRTERGSVKGIKNHFAPIAPMWFYGLMSGFIKNTGEDNESLWEGAPGSLLLEHFLLCLTTLVELSGPQASQVLSCDLLDLCWKFRTAEVVEVRRAVLAAVGTSLMLLPEQQLLTVLLRDDSEVPTTISQLSNEDPDRRCRELSQYISRNMYTVLNDRSLQN